MPEDLPKSSFPLHVLKRAERLGTLNKIDRRPQYEGPERARPEALLEAVNAQGNHIRGVQSDLGKIQRKVYDLKLRNSIVVAIVTAVLMRLPEIWQWFRSWIW